MTSDVIEKLRNYVKNGGNLFFASHGWAWQDYDENKSLVYEKDFANFVILKTFGIYLHKDYFGISAYDISGNLIVSKDEKV